MVRRTRPQMCSCTSANFEIPVRPEPVIGPQKRRPVGAPRNSETNNPMRLPFFCGWIIVVVTFVTMAIGVNARTAFSLLFPPILDEFGWERGLTAGAFSFGFLVSACLSPLVGRLMDRRGPRFVIEMGVLVMGCGLLLAPFVSRPWHLYATLGVLVGGGGN